MCGHDPSSDPRRPIPVVVFTGGPTLQHDVKAFLDRLEAHPEIDLRSAVCQSASQTASAVVADLWHRRGVLALPLLALLAADLIRRHLRHPWRERGLSRRMRDLADRIRFVPDIHVPEVLETVRALEPDLGLIYGAPLLRPELFEIPRFGTLGIHHGRLPEYRGKKTTFWAMFHGERTAGVTIQRVNAQLDRGEIVLQGEVEIGRRSLGTVSRELETLGLELYLRAVLDVGRGAATFQPTTGEKGRLYRDPKLGQLLIFLWRQLKRRLVGR